MISADKVFSGSIPEFYDTSMVPLIFEAYAEEMATRVASIDPTSVLETAAGSGVVPRALIRQLRPDARYVVTDLNQPMLDHAARRQTADKRIEWCKADALDLPFDDLSFDVVMCQFGAMFFPDRTKGYAEAWRVLKAGGTFFFSVWDKIESNEFANVVTNAAAGVFPDNPPLFLAHPPTAIATMRIFVRIWNGPDFLMSSLRASKRRVGHRPPGKLPLPIVREPHFATKLKSAIQIRFSTSQMLRLPLLKLAMGKALLPREFARILSPQKSNGSFAVSGLWNKAVAQLRALFWGCRRLCSYL